MVKDCLYVSVVQSKILWNRVGENLASIESLLEDAAPADLIVLPEMFATGFVADALPPEQESSGAIIDRISGGATIFSIDDRDGYIKGGCNPLDNGTLDVF